jgi:PTS system cellobiose-specific IIA component
MDVIQECMEMISYGGDAKSLALLAIKQSREGKPEEAAATMEKAEESLAKSHRAHTNLLSYDAENQDLQVTIFMVHAADHLNAAETIFVLAKELIFLHEEVQHV